MAEGDVFFSRDSNESNLKRAMLDALEGAGGMLSGGGKKGDLDAWSGLLGARERSVLADNEEFKKNPLGHVMKSLLFGANAMGPGMGPAPRPNIVTTAGGAPAPPGNYFQPAPLAEPMPAFRDPVKAMDSFASFGSERSLPPRVSNTYDRMGKTPDETIARLQDPARYFGGEMNPLDAKTIDYIARQKALVDAMRDSGSKEATYRLLRNHGMINAMAEGRYGPWGPRPPGGGNASGQ
jgi:hypothetical protein